MDDLMTIPLPMAAERNRNITGTIKAVSRRLLGFIRQRVANPQDAEDILQEVFYQFAGNTEPIEQVSSWLYRVARNKIIDNYRKQKLPLADDVFAASDAEEDGFNWKEVLLPADSDPETEYLRNLFWEQLQEALEELPEEQRLAFIETEIEGRPFKEIADRTGIPVPTLISRKRYAVLHLRERLRALKDEILFY